MQSALKLSARAAASAAAITPPLFVPNLTPLCPTGLWLAEMYTKPSTWWLYAIISGAALMPRYCTLIPFFISTRSIASAIEAPVGLVSVASATTGEALPVFVFINSEKAFAIRAARTAFTAPIFGVLSCWSLDSAKTRRHPEAESIVVPKACCTSSKDGNALEKIFSISSVLLLKLFMPFIINSLFL